MVTTAPAAVLGLPDYGISVGRPADPVVHDARSEAEALRLQARRFLVVRDGEVVARTQPADELVRRHGDEERVDFRPA